MEKTLTNVTLEKQRILVIKQSRTIPNSVGPHPHATHVSWKLWPIKLPINRKPCEP